MQTKITRCLVLGCLFLVGSLSLNYCQAKEEAPERTLTKKGQELEARYAAELAALQEKIKKELPRLDAKKVEAFMKATGAEKAADKDRDEKKKALEENRSRGLLNHRIAWVGRATTGVAEAKEKLKEAEAMKGGKKAEALKAAQEALAKIQENYNMAMTELKKCQDAAKVAEKEEPKVARALEDAEKKLVAAQANTQKSLKDLNLDKFLASSKLDAMLAKFEVLFEATPKGLAAFAQKGKTEEQLVEKLLKDTDLMQQMLVADGAKSTAKGKTPGYCKYGEAMRIYTDIQKASKKAQEKGVLQRLALASALEHSVPVKQSNPEAEKNAPEFVDPVKRYLHFEKAFLDGELDPAFKDLKTWDLRMVVNGEETEEALTWGRKMLRNYRPDQVTMDDYRWRYIDAVRTDITYGSQYNKYDEPELQRFQNILKNGGICGRRAFYGRFILRAFGIPTTARPQKGHAALTHWTPEGWVVCLGAPWGIGRTTTRYYRDLDFLASTQAREDEEAYLKVKRAHSIADVLGEPRVFGLYPQSKDQVTEMWNAIAVYTQRAIIEDLEAKTLAAVGTDIGESNELGKVEKKAEIELNEADKKILIGKDGTITIPATACSTPTKSTGKILFMESNLGGKQLHYGRHGGYEPFEYVLDVPKAGNYALTARVVTPSWKQFLLVSVNGSEKPINIDLPFTLGMWETTKPVKISLKEGENRLRFFREKRILEDARDKGITVRDFTLKPTK